MYRSIVFAVVLCLIKSMGCDDTVSYPEVEIESGRLIGSFSENRVGVRYAQFYGIPYGHVEKRFDVSTLNYLCGNTYTVRNLIYVVTLYSLY